MENACDSSAALVAPADGLVLSTRASDGQRVAEGETMLTLQPAGSLWVIASYYGADARAIRVGMTGTLAPAGDAAGIPIRIATIYPALSPDGGMRVCLVAEAANPDWLNGESGTVTLDGTPRDLPTVPTEALVLDQGKWWVLVHTSQGDRPQEVVPGPSRGWLTFIERGLAPGTTVVVTNAYLEFHRHVARAYQPPD